MFDFIFTLIVIAIIVYSVLYKKCPPDSALVVIDKASKKILKVITEGGAFVHPVFQDYKILSLKRTTVKTDVKNLLTKSNLRIDIELTCVIAISKNRVLLQNAAERLSGLTPIDISKWVKEDISGQLRLVCATYTVDEILDGSNFINSLEANISSELKKIGIEVINIYISSLKDTSGYIKSKKQQKQTKKAEKQEEKKTQKPVKQSFAQEFEEIAKKDIQQKEAEKQEINEAYSALFKNESFEEFKSKTEQFPKFDLNSETEKIQEQITEQEIKEISAKSVEETKKDLTEQEKKQTQLFEEHPQNSAEQPSAEPTPSDDVFASVRHYFENKNQ